LARKEKQSNQDTEHFKSGPWWAGAVEGGLLVWVLAIAAMRATFTETPHVEAMGRATALSNEAISLLMSAALLAAPVVWVIVGALAGRLRWRKTYFTGAVGVFCAAGLVGVWLASDKRAALTDLVVTASGPAAGLLAVQLFNGKGKVRLFLWLLLAVGAAATYACYDKMTIANDQLIGEYEKNRRLFWRRWESKRGAWSIGSMNIVCIRGMCRIFDDEQFDGIVFSAGGICRDRVMR
jgi:MFS family permease